MGRHQELLTEKSFEIRALETLYLGGGTPSLWGPRGASFLKELFSQHKISLKDGGEFTLEVNPGSYTKESIARWRDIGINRFSLGIQSLRSDYLKILDRVHSIEDVHNTLKFFKKENLAFSVDFMLGLPWSQSKKRKIEEELDGILQYDPEHISLYILTAKASYPHKSDLPEEEFLEEEYLKVAEKLKSLGYLHYEVSNFAKPGKESRHNLKYWRGESVAALGPSGVGFLKEAGFRFKWKTSKADFVGETLDKDAIALEKLYLGLRLNSGIRKQEHFSPKELQNVENLFQRWEKDGLAINKHDSLSLTSRGLLVLDGLMEQIFSAQKIQ